MIIPSHTVGSVFSRSVPKVRGDYVVGVSIRDIGIVMNENNAQQIGFNMSHISRSSLTRIYAGTISPDTSVYPKEESNRDAMAVGYPLVFDTYSSAEGTLYSGGEVGVVDQFKSYGADISVSIGTNKSSAPHAIQVSNADIQLMNTGIYVSVPTAGVSLKNNTIQYPAGASSRKDLMVIEGYGGTITGGYFEGKVDSVVRFKSSSKGWHVQAPYIGALDKQGVAKPADYFIIIATDDGNENFIDPKRISYHIWDDITKTWKNN